MESGSLPFVEVRVCLLHVGKEDDNALTLGFWLSTEEMRVFDQNKLQSVPCEDCWGWKVGVCLSWRCRFAFYRLEKKMTVLLRKDFGAFVVDRRSQGYEPQKKRPRGLDTTGKGSAQDLC